MKSSRDGRTASSRTPQPAHKGHKSPHADDPSGSFRTTDVAAAFGNPTTEASRPPSVDLGAYFTPETPLLVVDPNDLAATEVLPMLGDLGVQSVIAPTHGEGRNALEAGHHPLMILVLDKPAPGTRALVSAAQSHQPVVPVIVVTSDAKQLPRNLMEAGVAAVVSQGTLSSAQWRAQIESLLPDVPMGNTLSGATAITATEATSLAEGAPGGPMPPAQSLAQANMLQGIMDAVAKAQRDVGVAVARAKAAERLTEQTKEALGKKTGELREAVAQVATLNDKVRRLNETVQTTASQADTAERAGELVKKALHDKVDELMSLRADHTALRAERATLESRGEALLAERAQLLEQLKEYKQEAAHAAEQATSMAITIAELEQAAHAARDQSTAQQKVINEQKATLAALQSSAVDTRKKLDAQHAEAAGARNEFKALQDAQQKISSESAAHAARAADLQARLGTATSDLAAMKEDKQRLGAEITGLGQRVATLQAQLESARGDAVRAAAEVQRARELLSQQEAAQKQEAASRAGLEAGLAEKETALTELRAQLDQQRQDAERDRAQARMDADGHVQRITALEEENWAAGARVKDLEDKLMRYAAFLKDEVRAGPGEVAAIKARLQETEGRLLQAESQLHFSRAEWQAKETANTELSERLRAAGESAAWLQSQLNQAATQIQQLGAQVQAQARCTVTPEVMPVIQDLAQTNGPVVQAADQALQALTSLAGRQPELESHVHALLQLRLKVHLLQQRFK